MISKIKQILANTDRDVIGNYGWSILSLFLGIIVLPFMVVREIYQYKKYLIPCNIEFEYDDLIRYSLLIVLFSILHLFMIDMLGLPLILGI